MPQPRRTPPPQPHASHTGANTADTIGVIAVASCVWSQYFPQDHHIGIARPGDTRDASYYSLVSDSEGRFKAAVYDLTDPEVTTVWLNYTELVRSAVGLPNFENVLQENIDDVIPCLGIALCMLRHEQRQVLLSRRASVQ